MTEVADNRQAGGGAYLKDLLLLVLLFCSINTLYLGSYPLANPDEGRYAEIAREMVQSGDWVLPHLNHVVYFEKPPLVYWINAIGLSLFGGSEWVLRAVPFGFALLGVLFTYLGARGLGGRRAGWISAALVGSSLMYFMIGRILILDMAVSVLITGTLVCFLRGVREQPGRARRLWFMGLYACAALATLSKGLIGLAIPGAVMFLWLLVFNQWRRLLPMYLPTGAALYLLIAAPWHILAAQRHPDWAYFYFVHEHWLRFTTTIHDRYQPWWYFIPILLGGFMPWTFHLWGGIREACKGGWAGRKLNADLWFLLVWAVFIFLFFSRSQSKLVPYILPIFPALAIVGGVWMEGVIERREWSRLRLPAYAFFGFSMLLAAASVAVVLKPTLVRDTAVVVAARPQLIMMALIMLAGGLIAIILQRKGRPVSGLLVQATSWCAVLAVLASAAPHIQLRNSRDVAAVFSAKVQPGEEIFNYKCFVHDFVYYTGRPVTLVDHVDELEIDLDRKAQAEHRLINYAEFEKRWAGKARAWVLTRENEANQLKADPAGRYHLIACNRRYYLFSNQP